MLFRCFYFLQNEWPRYLLTFGWIIVNIIAFTVQFFNYENSLQYFYLREIVKNGLAFSRASAFCINLNCAILLLLVCRNFISFTRTLVRCCPTNTVRVIDKHISFHRHIGYIIIFFSIVHTLGHISNVENFVLGSKTQAFNASDKSGLISTLSLQPNGVNPVTKNSNAILESFKLLAGISGIIMCLALSLIASSSSELIRRSFYNLFWYSHQILAVIFFGFFVVHGLQGIIKMQTNLDKNDPQKCYLDFLHWSPTNKRCDVPKFAGSMATSWIWVLPSIVIYLIERLARFLRGLRQFEVISYKMHPSQVLELCISNSGRFRINYRAGQYIYLKVRSISLFEWHPFTITSSPNDLQLSVHIRNAGDWTSKLQEKISGDEPNDPLIKHISIDGPYGSCAEDIFKYPKVVLIGAGIGVTPYSSILKHIWHTTKNSNEILLKKIYFFWIAPSIDTFEWFGAFLQNLEKEMKNKNKQDLLEYKLYLTRGWSLKEAKKIAENHLDTYDLFTGLEQKTNYGRPNFEQFFNELANKNEETHKERVGVFFCGPATLSKQLHKLCNTCSNEKTSFYYNKENF